MADRIYRYLVGTQDLGLVAYNLAELEVMKNKNITTVSEHFDKSSVIGYTDASFAPNGGKSQGCFVITWAGTPLFWRCSKQAFATLSTAESELLEATEGYTGLQSIIAILQEFAFEEEFKQYLMIDNNASVSIIVHENVAWRTRHLKIRANVLREQVEQQNLVVKRAPGVVQLADLGTKSLPATRLQSLVQLWSLRKLPSTDSSVSRVNLMRLDADVATGLVRMAIFDKLPYLDIGNIDNYYFQREAIGHHHKPGGRTGSGIMDFAHLQCHRVISDYVQSYADWQTLLETRHPYNYGLSFWHL